MDKKKLFIIILSVLTVIAVSVGIFFLSENRKLSSNKLEIIDATYSCSQVKEKIYEDNQYKYYLPCKKSNSVFVKINNNKLLIKDALNSGTVKIGDAIKAGLDVIKEKK